MVLTPLYVGQNKREGFFNIPSKKKTSNFVKKEQNEKNLAELVIEKALSNLKEKEPPKK
ncbi:hypothetical protein [Paenibacillus odorifer]|uniref:hypothetical protein n=1 Tax=Paenibacillus odorifer TaxID=189426 RepID=UPI0015C2FE10|nr:hypothetical protein [Paenibacillus odorifer]